MPSLSEKEYLAELIHDFPTSDPITAEQASKLLETRYRQLEQASEDLLKVIREGELPFSSSLYHLTNQIHRFLYAGILSNAGQFRQHSDREYGFVGFGGELPRKPSMMKFQGSSPDTIEQELEETFKLLSQEDGNPVRTSILLYQKFVRIHPFYDANRPIARYILTLYLSYYGYYVKWKELEQSKKNEFLKKLNSCHLRENEGTFDSYFEYLLKFWEKFVVKKKIFELE